MILNVEKLFTYLFLSIPLFLITGPAIPDIIITIGIIFSIFYLFFLKKYKEILKINFFRISVIFWISLIIISIFSYNKNNSFQDAIIFIRFLLIPLCCYFIFFKDMKIFKKSLFIILILVIFVCIDTFYQFLNYKPESGFGEDLLGFKSNWYGRLTGPFRNELIPGSYISKFGLLGFSILISIKNIKNNSLVKSIYLSLILYVCYISGERMAFAVFALALFVLFVFLYEQRKSIVLSIIFGTLLIIITVYLHPFYNDFKVLESTEFHQGQKIEKFFACDHNDEATCTKIVNLQPSFFKIIENFKTSAYGEIYLLSYKMFLDNPISGIGINNFEYMCKNFDNYKNMMSNYNCASHPHNIYIQWLTEGGIIVISCFLLYLFYMISFILYNKGDREYKVISLVIILIMFWPIMSTGSLIKNWYGVITFFIIGLCLCLSKFKNSD